MLHFQSLVEAVFPSVLFRETFGTLWKPVLGSSPISSESGVVFLHWTVALSLALIRIMLQ